MLPSGGFFVKHSFRLPRPGAALFALALLLVAGAGARAQTLSPTPDTLTLQVTNTTIPAVPTPTPSPTPSPTPTPTGTPTPLARNSFSDDVSGNGRFVVIESEGDISTERTAQRNNADGNLEIFLFDYAQRRIFQITNTKNALKDPTASPIDNTNIDVHVVNQHAVISHDGRFIVFVSNAYSDASPGLTPANFDGNANAAALHADGNTEIFIYQIPQAPDADLSSGAEVAPVDLAAGTMTRLTFTPASTVPRAGASGLSPFFALDNDWPAVNDDASIIAFVSDAKSGIPGESNADGNREIFILNRTSGAFVQVTNTQDVPPSSSNPLGTLVWNTNPSLSGSGSVLAFISNADIGTSEAAANKGNGEIYVASFNGTAVSGLRAVTQTPPQATPGFEQTSINLLNPGRRLSRDGKLLAFESVANFNSDGSLPSTPLASSTGLYVYNIAANTFTLVANRPPSDQADVGERWPTFTGDSSRLVWSSVLNLKTDGTVLAVTDTSGLNPGDNTQIFTAPVSALNQITRLTNRKALFTSIQPLPSDSINRLTAGLSGGLGGDTVGVPIEVFYLLTPNVTSETPAPSPTPAASPAPVSFFTGASLEPVVGPSPAPTPPAVSGLAPGELGIMTSTLTLAPSQRQVSTNNADEVKRRPPLPVELNGVSVSVSGAAAGLYFVAPNQINFVVPPALAASATQPVVIFNNGAVIRTSVQLNPAQPDIFTSTNGPGGRAAVLNVTNPCVAPSGEPFTVTTTVPKGSQTTGNCATTDTESVPTRLLIMLTGIRGVTATQNVSVTIGTTTIAGTADPVAGPIHFVGPSLTPGFDQIIVELPATLAGAGDVPVVVSVTTSGGTFTSRPADTAPHIRIQ
jgi:uncharacterized protein (TIGR03437 family)